MQQQQQKLAFIRAELSKLDQTLSISIDTLRTEIELVGRQCLGHADRLRAEGEGLPRGQEGSWPRPSRGRSEAGRRAAAAASLLLHRPPAHRLAPSCVRSGCCSPQLLLTGHLGLHHPEQREGEGQEAAGSLERQLFGKESQPGRGGGAGTPVPPAAVVATGGAATSDGRKAAVKGSSGGR